MPTATDLEIGAFSDTAPWVVDPAHMPWRIGVDDLRRRVRAEVPDLTRARRLPPGGRAAVVARHVLTALVPWAVGARRAGGSRSTADLSRRLRKAAEKLGPTYIKLGQIISSGEGLFPDELVSEFKLCRDQVPPETFESVRRVVEDDLGRPLAEVFASFERRPLAAASIAQVHAATLLDGTEVVVKVQRPDVARRVRADLQAMAWIAPHLVGRIPVAALTNPPALVELFAETIVEELDFRLEAENMLDVAHSIASLGGDARASVIARPHPELITRRVLVMERLRGLAFDDLEGMRAAGVDVEKMLRANMISFLEGCMLHGIFHGDLHGGNLFVLADGRTALLDHGIVGRLDEPRRLAFLRLLISATMNDLYGQLAAARDLGALPADADLHRIVKDLRLDQPVVDPTTLTPEELSAELQHVVKGLLATGARMPKELMLFVKNLVFLDGAIAHLAPDLDLFGEIAHVSSYFATAHGERIAAEVGLGLESWNLDMGGIKAMYGVEEGTERLTHRELRGRRDQLREGFAKGAKRARDRRRRAKG